MIQELRNNTRRTGIQLIIVLVLFMLLGVTLAVMIRKEQSLVKLRTSHRSITANLPVMEEDTRRIREQMANFRRLIPAENGGRSLELLVFSRLDQVKAALPQSTMTVFPLEKKDGNASVAFSLKVPIQNYATAINIVGRLQTETFPFVIINRVALDAVNSGQFSIDGSVVMPLAAEGKR